MAEQGFELNIEGLQEAINKAEQSITKLATTTKTQTKKIVESFNDLSKNGLGSFVQKLNEATSALDKFGKGANTGGFKEVKREVKSTVDEVVRLTNTLNDLKKADKLKIGIEKEKADYKKEINDIKELKNAEAERARELERQRKTDIAAAGIRDASLKREALNIEKERALEIRKTSNAITQASQKEQLSHKRSINATREKINIEKEKARAEVRAEAQRILYHKDEVFRLRQQIKEMDRLTKAYLAMPTRLSIGDVDKILGDSKGARTINQRITAIHNMRSALKDLDTSTKQGKERARELTKEIERQEKELRKLGITLDSVKNKQTILTRYSRQLRNALLMVFSLSQIKNYITQLVKIRAEFEMQQRSLEVLLQSKDEANKLWSQTIQLAIKSPFTVKELVTYTKQLAAYRIESDKLYETNKMLADVSAGLGVDMNRLILAFGQVKAANYLRGTELRQFSEAGVNMLGELAKYFTELEGRAVSVGQVFEMISKRQVDFKDVEEVFKRITSEGGLFYEMQEKQSETTLGMWRNLIDSLHLMFNEIGKANDGPIKDFIKGLRDMINGWQEVIHTVKIFFWASSPILAYFVSTKLQATLFGKQLIKLSTTLFSGTKAMTLYRLGLIKISGMMKSATLSTKVFGVALKGLTSILKGVALGFVGWGIFELIALFTEWVSSIGEARREMNRLKDSIAQVNTETQKDLNESIGQYRRLATTLLDVTKSYKEREEAMKSMNRIFGDILPQEMLEVENIRAMGAAYKDATDALRLHYATAAEERKKALVDEKLDPKIQEEAEKVIFASLYRHVKYSKGSYAPYAYFDEEGLSSVMGNVIQDAKNGLIEFDNLNDEYIKRVETYYNVKFPELISNLKKDFENSFEQIRELLEKRQELLNISVGTQFITEKQKEQFEESNEKRKAYEKEKEALDKLSAAYSTYYNLLQRGVTDAKTLNSAQKDVYNAYNELGIGLPTEMAFKEIVKDALSIKEEVSRVGIQLAENFGDGLKKGASNNPYLKNFVEETIGKDIKEFKGNEWTKAIEKEYKKASEKFNVDLNFVDKFLPNTDMAISDLRTAFETEIEKYQDAIKKFETASEKSKDTTEQEGAAERLQTTRGEIDRMKKELPALIWLFERLGGELKGEKGEKGRSSAGKDWYLELAKGLQSVHKDFLTLNKDLDKTRAKVLALEKNTDVLDTAFTNAGVGMKEFMSSFDLTTEEGFIASLDDLINIVLARMPAKAQETKIAIEKILSDIKGEAEISVSIENREVLDEYFDNMFRNYELTMEVENMGLNSDWFADLFNFEKTDLDKIRRNIQNTLGLNGELLNDVQLFSAIGKSNLPEETQKMLRGYLTKIMDEDAKALEESMKKFMEYSKNALSSVGQIRVAESQELTRINSIIDNEIKKAGDDTEKLRKLNDLRTHLLGGIKNKAESDVDKALWEEFKGSEGFIRIFQDAEYVSNKAINNMILELEKFKDSMSDMNVDEIKAVVDAMEKLESMKMERHPMVEMFKSMRDLGKNKEAIRNLSVEDNAELGITGVAKGGFRNRKDLTKYIEKYNEKIEELRKDQKTYADSGKTEKASQIDATIQRLIKQRKELQKVKDAGEDASKRIREGFGKFGSKINEVGQSLSTFQNAFENMGVNFSDGMKDALGTTQEVLGGIGAMAQSIASGNYLQALMGLFQTLGALFQIGDKRKERQIQDNIKAIEKLGKAYEKLEKKIEEAYSIDTLQSATNSAMDNLEQQIKKQEEIIALEEAKKKNDEDKLEEYNDQLVEQKEQLEELKKEVISKATDGAFDDVLSAADGFVDAWLEAFKETGDGLKGLEDNFNEMMLNIVKRQASLQIAGVFAERWKKDLEKYVNADDTKLTTDEALKFAEAVKADMPELSEALKAYFEAMKSAVDLNGEGDTMSGLQRGIESLSEETGGIIAALLESIRFGVFDRNTKLEQFLNSYNTNLNTALSPILTQVTNIATDTSAIRSLLDSVITAYQGNGGGRGVKMAM